MDRQVKPTDDYSSKLLKYIPAEISGAYLAINSLVPPQGNNLLMAGALVILLVLCALYLRQLQSVTSSLQIVLSLILFVIWAVNISSARLDADLDPLILGVVLILATVALPLLPVRSAQ